MDDMLCYFVMELCEKSVVKALEQMQPWPVEADLLRIIYEIMLALKHLQSCSVVHRDVKPDNFLLGGNGGMVTKLCDFGLSSVVGRSNLVSMVGTPPYMSPEMVNSLPYNTKTDMWSLGATAYVMLYGRFPYEPEVRTTANMKRVVARGLPAPQYKPIDAYPQPSTLAERIVRAFLIRNPTKRENAGRALETPLGKELQRAVASRNEQSEMESPVGSRGTARSFLPVVLAAQQEIEVFKSPAGDPTEQHSIDQILEMMRLHQPRARSFTVPTKLPSSQQQQAFHNLSGDALPPLSQQSVGSFGAGLAPCARRFTIGSLTTASVLPEPSEGLPTLLESSPTGSKS